MSTFEPTARAAPTAAQARTSVRNSRHSDSAEMSALLAPEGHGAPVRASAARCTASAVPTVTSACAIETSKSSRAIP